MLHSIPPISRPVRLPPKKSLFPRGHQGGTHPLELMLLVLTSSKFSLTAAAAYAAEITANPTLRNIHTPTYS